MTTPPSKVDAVLNWIAHGPVRIRIDATRPGVVVPKHLRKSTDLSLDWGFDLPKPIPHMKIDAEAISGTLSFAGYGPVFCVVPWAAVFCVGSHVTNDVRVWLNDAPAEVQREVLRVAGEEANKKARRPALRLIKGGG